MSLIAPGLFDFFKGLSLIWRVAAVAVALFIVLVVFGLIYRSCTAPPPPKLDQEQTIKAQQAIEKNDRKEMIQVLAESDAEEAVADGIVNNAKANTVNAIKESKEKWANASNEDLAAELNRRASQE